MSVDRHLRTAAALLLAAALPAAAWAHVRSESFSQWHFQDNLLSVRFTVDAREVTRVAPGRSEAQLNRDLARYLDSHIGIVDLSASCAAHAGFSPVEARPGYLQAVARWHCGRLPERIVVDAFFDHAAEHTHFATLEEAGATRRYLLTGEQRGWQPSAPGVAQPGPEARFTDFLELGFRHIMSGPDHVLFLLVLLIACRRPREIFWAVSGFTLGHSLTLGLASTGVIEPNLPAVEATIGLTIALVAAERAAHDTRHATLLALGSVGVLALLALSSPWISGLEPAFLAALALFVFCYLLLAPTAAGKGSFRILVTTLFGLVHGLGFATAFQAARLEPGQMLWPLAGFNMGVELGQLILVGLMGAAAIALRSRRRLAALSADLAGAAACAMGLYWFVERSFS